MDSVWTDVHALGCVEEHARPSETTASSPWESLPFETGQPGDRDGSACHRRSFVPCLVRNCSPVPLGRRHAHGLPPF